MKKSQSKPQQPLHKLEYEYGKASSIDQRFRLDPRVLSWDLFLFGEVNQDKVSEMIQHIITLDVTPSQTPINILINSVGGECLSGLALIDVMLSTHHPIRTIVLGEAASMAALITIAGELGQRFMGTRAQILFHPLSSYMEDYLPYIKDRVKWLESLEETFTKLMKTRTKLPDSLIKKASNGELWLTPELALKYGVIDRIINDEDKYRQLVPQPKTTLRRRNTAPKIRTQKRKRRSKKR